MLHACVSHAVCSAPGDCSTAHEGGIASPQLSVGDRDAVGRQHHVAKAHSSALKDYESSYAGPNQVNCTEPHGTQAGELIYHGRLVGCRCLDRSLYLRLHASVSHADARHLHRRQPLWIHDTHSMHAALQIAAPSAVCHCSEICRLLLHVVSFLRNLRPVI